MLKINDILCTKDGRKIGNAIVQEVTKSRFNGELLYKIKTDYGNEAYLSQEEIDSEFYTEQKEIPEGFPVEPHKYAV